MKATTIGVAAAIVLACSSAAAQKSTYVKPHVTKNGTYVEGHYRTAPDSSRLNNYSTQGNVNPYTGKAGQADPFKYQAPSYPAQQYMAPTYPNLYEPPRHR